MRARREKKFRRLKLLEGLAEQRPDYFDYNLQKELYYAAPTEKEDSEEASPAQIETAADRARQRAGRIGYGILRATGGGLS